jgi:hypothetical protein
MPMRSFSPSRVAKNLAVDITIFSLSPAIDPLLSMTVVKHVDVRLSSSSAVISFEAVTLTTTFDVAAELATFCDTFVRHFCFGR